MDPVEHGSNHSLTSNMVDVWLNLIPKKWNPSLEHWSRHLSDENSTAEAFIGERFRIGDETDCLVARPKEDEPTKLAAFNSLLRLVRLILSVSSTMDVFRQRKFDRSGLISFRGFMIKAVGWHCQDKLESNLNAYFADMLIRTAPLSERSSGVVEIFRGSLNRYCRLLVLRGRNGDKVSLTFIRSLLESKRLWFQLSEMKEKKSMEDHKRRLGTALPPLSRESKRWLEMATDLVFKKGIKYVPGNPLPTRSAGLTVSRAWGGAFEKYSLNVPLSLFPNGLTGIELTEVDYEISPVLGLRDRARVFDETQCLAFKLMSEGVRNCDILCDTAYRYESTSLRDIMRAQGQHSVRYQSLPEPGKFRVITAGPESLYTAVRPVQQWMLGVWKDFKLSTMHASWVDRFRQSVTSSDGGLFVSGDYEATTDLLAAESTQVIHNRIKANVVGLPVHMVKWMDWCLRPATIEYPDGDSVEMKNGQLMGNPLSFVYLCIANLSTLIRTFDQIGLGIDDIVALINGDDIFFEIPCMVRGWPMDISQQIELYKKWKAYASELNLQLSLGKNYLSSHIAMINNVMFTKDGTEIQYLRTALSIGHRVKSSPSVSVDTMSGVEEKLLLPIRPESGLELILNFRKRFRSELVTIKVKGLPDFTPNWFFPKSLGGRGLKNYLDKPVESSVAQRRLAGFLMRNPFEQFKFSYLSARKELPRSVELAIKDVQAVSAFERSNDIGPLTVHEDLDSHLDSMLSRFLRKHRWVRDISRPKKTVTLKMPKSILESSYIPPIRTILAYRSPHFRVAGVETTWPSVNTLQDHQE